MTRPLNAATIKLIQGFETLQLVGMLPTGKDVPTAGYGHTGPDVVLGQRYDMNTINAWFAKDTAWASDTVSSHTTAKLNDNQFGALVSLCYNIGAGNFDSSTLLKDINACHFEDAAAQFAVWRKQAGIILPGLVRRRAAEVILFNTPC